MVDLSNLPTVGQSNWGDEVLAAFQALNDGKLDTATATATYVAWVESDAEADALPAGTLALVLEPVDSEAPTVPTDLAADEGDSEVVLTWTASTDNIAVTGYRVYRGGVLVASPTATTYTDATVTNGVEYSYTVSAVDAAGNESAQTSAVLATPEVAVPQIIAQATSTVAAGATQAITLPATVAAGDVLAVVGAVGVASTFTFTVPAGWTKRLVHAPGGQGFVLTKTATGSEGGTTVTLTWNVSPGKSTIACAYTLRDVAEAPTTATTAQAFGLTSAVPSLTGLAAGAIVLGVAWKAADGGGTCTPPAGWTEDYEATDAAGTNVVDIAHITDADGGTGPSGSWTFTGTNGNNAALAAAFA